MLKAWWSNYNETRSHSTLGWLTPKPYAQALKRRHKRAVVAVARKLAVITHAMKRDGTEYLDRPADITTPTTTSAGNLKLLGAFV